MNNLVPSKQLVMHEVFFVQIILLFAGIEN